MNKYPPGPVTEYYGIPCRVATDDFDASVAFGPFERATCAPAALLDKLTPIVPPYVPQVGDIVRDSQAEQHTLYEVYEENGRLQTVEMYLDGSDESMRDITLVCRPSEHHATQ